MSVLNMNSKFLVVDYKLILVAHILENCLHSLADLSELNQLILAMIYTESGLAFFWYHNTERVKMKSVAEYFHSLTELRRLNIKDVCIILSIKQMQINLKSLKTFLLFLELVAASFKQTKLPSPFQIVLQARDTLKVFCKADYSLQLDFGTPVEENLLNFLELVVLERQK